jgi:hypothetical protein
MGAFGQKVLKKWLGEANAGLDSSHGDDTLHDVLASLILGLQNRVLDGLVVIDPTTASTQATGAAGALAWRVNVAAGEFLASGARHVAAAIPDFVVYNGPAPLQVGQSIVAAIVAKRDGTLAAVLGSPALSGRQGPPSDGAIQAAVGYADRAGEIPLPWIKVAHATLNRTTDTVVTQSEDATVADFGAANIFVEQ